MREQDIQRQILDYLRQRGVWATKVPLGPMKAGSGFATPNPMRGFPDILACRHGRFIGIEVKKQAKNLSHKSTRVAQERMQQELRNAGALVLQCSSLGPVVALIDQVDAEYDRRMQAGGGGA